MCIIRLVKVARIEDFACINMHITLIRSFSSHLIREMSLKMKKIISPVASFSLQFMG
jgi:hypothetical protein